MLAGTGFLHNLYWQANSYPNLLDQGIMKKIDQMPMEEIHKMSWQIVQSKFEKDIEQALNIYRQKKAENGESTMDINDIVQAAYFQRVHTLFAAENVHAWGTYNPDLNKVTLDEEPSITNDDLINFAASHTLINGGEVLLIPHNQIPDHSKAAAILRF